MARAAFREDVVQPSWVDSIEGYDMDSAGRLYLQAKRDANDRTLRASQRQQARGVMTKLVQRFPGVVEHSATAADHELGIDNHPELKETRDQHRAEHDIDAGEAARRRRNRGPAEPRKAPQPPSRRGHTKTAGRLPRPARQVGQRAYRTAGGPGLTDMALTVLGATVAFAVLYAVLSNADRAAAGKSAIELISGSVGRGIDLFLRPVDPLTAIGGSGQVGGAAAGAIGRSGDAISKALTKRAANPPKTTTHVPFDPKPNG